MWFDLQLGNKFKVKYTPISIPENDYPNVDSDGTPLTKVAGSFAKGYFINEKTGQKVEKAYKLINGQVSSGWTGRIKEVKDDEMFFVDENEADDLIVENTNLVESQKLYDELTEKKQALIFAGFFGTGTKIYKCYITPSKQFKGFCIMRGGRGQLSQQISNVVGELTEYRELKKKIEQIELNAKKVNNLNPMDILKLNINK